MDDVTLLRDLAVRLLAARLMMPTDLLVGRLPPDLTVSLPLPPGSRLLGSLVQGREATVVYTVPLRSREVYDFYHEQLRAQGWHERTHQPGQRHRLTFDDQLDMLFKAMLHPRAYGSAHAFDWSETGPTVYIEARDVPDHPTDVWLYVDPDPRMAAPSAWQDRSLARLPTLTPPPGVRPWGTATSASKTTVSQAQQLFMRTRDMQDDAVQHIHAHYATQLEQAGWTGVSEHRCAPYLVWSTWLLPPDDEGRRQGQVYVLRKPVQPLICEVAVLATRDRGEQE